MWCGTLASTIVQSVFVNLAPTWIAASITGGGSERDDERDEGDSIRAQH